MDHTLFATSFVAPKASTIAPETLCPSDVPLVLLPVRLETRFFPLANGAQELRVRIYPDTIHVDTHHLELTTDERIWGTRYWQDDWAAGADEGARANAWATLASRFGAERAAWIARVLEPTNIGQRPTSAPIFPSLPPVVGPNGEDAWRQAPQARGLPEKWYAMLHANGDVAVTATSKPIARPLNVGPDPTAPSPTAEEDAAIKAGDALALDQNMRWMVDFEAAVDKGMALRLTVPATLLAAGGIDKLVVFGVDTSLTPSAGQLADLLDAHHYTDGLRFLPLGTPTNNTDDRRAGYSSDDPGHARSFAYEVLANPATAANALRVGYALGLTSTRVPATLGRIAGADENHDLDQLSMNTALWQVGWGYYLTNMMGAETGLTKESLDWARDHFIRCVRSGGPYPTLCVGRQPYGILPVTSLDLWAPGTGEAVGPQDSWVKTLLLNMREQIWRKVLPNVARIGLRASPREDPDSDLADVMRADALSHDYAARPVFGRHFLEHLHLLSAVSFASLAQQQDAIADAMLKALSLPTAAAQRPHLSHGFHADATTKVTAPVVQAGEISPWRKLESRDASQPNYIARLLGLTKITDIIAARPLPTAADRATPLLEMLARHAMLREIATAAARIAAANGAGDFLTLVRDLELIDLVDVPVESHVIKNPLQPTHWRRQLAMQPSKITNGRAIAEYIETATDLSTLELQALRDFRASLTHLMDLDSESLQFLTQGTLDLSAHRLDAWITSFATKRLTSMTSSGSGGQRVGAYGWVENLVPANPLVQVPAASMPAGETTPLYALPKDSGFIHAPSVTHATAAALLRNAHLGPAGVPTDHSPFAIDLSSRRVREASRLIDGVRQGQPLTALLGYRLERRLHDLRLDRFIAALRRAAPLAVREREANAAPTEALAANNVVDALVLLRLRQDPSNTRIDDELAKVPNSSDTDRGTVKAAIDALADSVDGLSDALVAEAAYQMARGNAPRLASTLAAVAQGDALPPELEVVKTPRSGNPITYRTLVVFTGTSNAPAGWTYASTRSVLERWLATWTRSQLGDARTVRCTVEQVGDDGTVTKVMTFPLNDVPISPLDFVYNVQPAGQSKDAAASPSVVEQLVLYHARRSSGALEPDAVLRLQHARPDDLGASESTLFDVLEQARALRGLLEHARGMRPEDLAPPESGNVGSIDLVDYENRVVHFEAALFNAHRALSTLVADASATAESLRTAMLSLGDFGVGPFVPSVAVGDTPEIRAALVQQASAMLRVGKQRLDRDAALVKETAATEERARYGQLLARAKAVYGEEFVSLPSLSLDATRAPELNAALAASTTQQGGNALEVHSWFARASRVRDNMARLGACLRGSEVLGGAGASRLDLRVAQLPFDANERWVGLQPEAGAEIPPSKLSLIVQQYTPIDATKPLCGLFVDEWVEVVPNQTETTALAFQYNPPNAFAPQNVLVAVPPVPGQPWTTETLRRVLVDTLDLTKLRAVDPSLLGAAAQYLPALYIPFNTADDAVSTDFAPLTA